MRGIVLVLRLPVILDAYGSGKPLHGWVVQTAQQFGAIITPNSIGKALNQRSVDSVIIRYPLAGTCSAIQAMSVRQAASTSSDLKRALAAQ